MITAKLKFFSLALIFFLSVYSCKVDPPLIHIENLNGNKIFAFGHEGMGISWRYPINTYQSLEECLNLPVDGTEMDVQMTSDSVLFAFHASDLSEVSNCSGRVNDHTWSEIKDCLYNSPISSDLHFITIDSLFQRMKDPGKFIFTFDTKWVTGSSDLQKYQDQFTSAIVRIAKKFNLEDHLYVESQIPAFLDLLRQKDEKIKLFFYPANYTTEEAMELAKKKNWFGITVSNKNTSREQVQEAHRMGLRVTLWNTQTEADNLNAIKKNPDFIQTDKINNLLTLKRSN